MRDLIQHYLHTHQKTLEKVAQNLIPSLEKAIAWIVQTYQNHKKTLWCGNGGSASDALHAVGELVGRFKLERKPLPALTLGSELATATAIGNDYGFKQIFSREVEAWGEEGDVLIGISTSGNSENVILAVKKAHQLKMKTIALLGKDGGKLKSEVDLALIIPSQETPQIQEMHIMLIHIICAMIEKKLFH